jgi:hypothetical protein
MAWIEVQPAYGRDYKNQREAVQDWKDNKDFQITEPGIGTGASYGQYVTRGEATDLNVTLRYGKGLKVMSLPK